MSYDPFTRGPLPVGVRSLELADEARGRSLPVELWYPAGDAHAGRDLDEATQDRYRWLAALPPVAQQAVRDAAPRPGRCPLVVFSHGFAGHRRQSTHLCTHLASHGYLVAAVDHPGNTTLDVVQRVLELRVEGGALDPRDFLEGPIEDRPRDVRFAIDRLLDGAGGAHAGLPEPDPERVGLCGHSFGGWTALVASGRDPRVRAALALAPAGGASRLPAELIAKGLDLDWEREIPTLFVAAEDDTLCPLDGILEIRRQTRGARGIAVLANADHFHFCDRAEQIHEFFRASLVTMPPGVDLEVLRRARPAAELCPGEHAYRCTRALGLALMDAHLADDPQAEAFLAGDLVSALAAREVAIRFE